MTTRRRKDHQGGQAFVETGLILIVFLGVFIGILDFGQFLYIHQGLVERARTGIRWAAVNGAGGNLTNWQTQVQNVVAYNTPTAPPGGGGAVFFNLTTSMVTATDNNSGTPRASRTVVIANYPYTFFTPWIGKAVTARTITLSMPTEVP